MLSIDSSSSIQKRRQLHRRQQSLEVPILATPIPVNPRRNPSRRHGHRRGLSLDQSLSPLGSPTGFRPLLVTQEVSTPSGSPSVRIQLEDHSTNTGQLTPDPQHFVQETQQHHPAQPGYQAQDFSAHLQKHLNGDLPPSSIPPSQPPNSQHQQQQAFQELQNHMAWYRQTYGPSPGAASMQEIPFVDASQPVTGEMQGMPLGLPTGQSMPIMPSTPVSQTHACTVPNTPQNFAAHSWPSPPPTDVKHARSQSFQLDVAPMPGSSFGTATVDQTCTSFSQSTTAWVNENGYASSTYSPSAVDPLSPGRQLSGPHMPTLFEEEATPPLGARLSAQGGFNESSLLLSATARATQDFNDPDFDFGAPMAMSPRQQLLDALGPNIPASIVNTGVPAQDIQQYIGEYSDDDKRYPCLWEGCDRRFGRKENIRAHVQTHLGDRQFKCDVCDKTFVRQHDLKRHIAIHSDDRPHVCPCGTGFARHDALTRHRQRGMCHGALPGFEKADEEKPKRGRPKKERPDIEARTDKASRQRKRNKDRAEGEANGGYASSSSGASDRSFPVTPPESSDTFDADAFLNLANGDMQFDGMTGSWRDTPPTSPVSTSPTKTAEFVSPAMLSNYSSPPSHHISDYASPAPTNNVASSFHGGSSPVPFDFFDGTVPPQPTGAFDVFSPPGDSSSSSVYMNASDCFEEFLEMQASHPKCTSVPLSPQPVQRETRSLAAVLDEWMASH